MKKEVILLKHYFLYNNLRKNIVERGISHAKYYYKNK